MDAGAASLLIASTPVWTALLAMIALHERLSLRGWGGVLMSFAGVALIASGQSEGIHLSPQALVVLAAAVSSAVYTVQQKHFLSWYSALEFTAYSIWAGTLLTLPFGNELFHAIRTAPMAGTWAIVYLGVFPGATRVRRLGLRVVTRNSRSNFELPLPYPGTGHCHCLGVAG